MTYNAFGGTLNLTQLQQPLKQKEFESEQQNHSNGCIYLCANALNFEFDGTDGGGDCDNDDDYDDDVYCTVLCNTAVMQFSRLVMSEKVIRRLLKQDVVVSVSLSDPNCKRILYERGRPANYFILVVEGHVQIRIGSEDFVFDGGPFMYFGAQALTGIHSILYLLYAVVGRLSCLSGSA